MEREKIVKVSVIIPVFNAERYICTCLDSLIGQSMDMVEIICVDDCSDDGTAAKLNSYAEKYKSIKVITEDVNRGQAYARNIGIRHALGKYVYFLDADDMLKRKDSLKCLYMCAEKNDAQILVFDSEVIYEDEVCRKLWGDIHRFSDVLKEGAYKGDSFFLNMIENPQSSIAVWRQFYNRKFIVENKLMFDNNTSPHEDMLFTFKAMVFADNVYYYPRLLHRYRLHYGSSSVRRIDKKRILSYMNLLDCTIKFFLNRRISKETGMALFLYYKKIRNCIEDGFINSIKNGIELFDNDNGRWEFYRLLLLMDRYRFLKRPFSCTEYTDMTQKQVIVYGNGGVSIEVCDMLERFGITNYVIAVTNNSNEKHGILNIEDFKKCIDDCFVIIASQGKNKEEMEELLKKYFFKYYTCVS